MRKNLSTIILILIFLVGLSVMLYPSVSDAVNRKHQSRAVASYAEEVEQLSDADYQTYFDAADAYNRQLNTTPMPFINRICQRLCADARHLRHGHYGVYHDPQNQR